MWKSKPSKNISNNTHARFLDHPIHLQILFIFLLHCCIHWLTRNEFLFWVISNKVTTWFHTEIIKGNFVNYYFFGAKSGIHTFTHTLIYWEGPGPKAQNWNSLQNEDAHTAKCRCQQCSWLSLCFSSTPRVVLCQQFY